MASSYFSSIIVVVLFVFTFIAWTSAAPTNIDDSSHELFIRERRNASQLNFCLAVFANSGYRAFIRCVNLMIGSIRVASRAATTTTATPGEDSENTTSSTLETETGTAVTPEDPTGTTSDFVDMTDTTVDVLDVTTTDAIPTSAPINIIIGTVAPLV